MFSEDPILLPEIVDQIVLVTVHPASEREDEELQRRRHSLTLLGRLDQHRPSLGRFFAPYALTDRALVTRCAGLRPGPLDTPVASGKHTLRSLARRWLTLADEITTHDLHLARLTAETSPTLREGFAVGANTAAAMLIIFGDNPERTVKRILHDHGLDPAPARNPLTPWKTFL